MQQNKLLNIAQNKFIASDNARKDIIEIKSNMKTYVEKNVLDEPSNAEINYYANKIVAPNYSFSRSQKASADLGTIKNKVIINIDIAENERFSYLSLLSEYKWKLQNSIGINSKELK